MDVKQAESFISAMKITLLELAKHVDALMSGPPEVLDKLTPNRLILSSMIAMCIHEEERYGLSHLSGLNEALTETQLALNMAFKDKIKTQHEVNNYIEEHYPDDNRLKALLEYSSS